MSFLFQLFQAQNDQFNMRAHVEYEWRLGQEDMYESDDDLDEKVRALHFRSICELMFIHCSPFFS